MFLIDILTQIGTSILIGYLAITGYVADSIQSFFDSETAVVSQHEETITSQTKPSLEKAKQVLLNNQKFQQVAQLASSREEVFEEPDDSVPLEERIQNALVNIYCQYQTEEYIRTTTGTGYFINPKGIIVTNAHVAQFLLLEGTSEVVENAECVIRTGDPATSKYKAELLYISPLWIFENAELIDHETPRGTGERDYALLYISESTDNTPLPTRFPSIQTNTNLLARAFIGETIMSGGYPAEKLIREGSDTLISPVVAESQIESLYTFGSNYADIFTITDSPVGEHGASGGPIVNPIDETAIGIIVTKGDQSFEGEHSLRALTLSYVDRTIIEETGYSLTQNMQGDPALRGGVFMGAIGPFLRELLEEELAQ